MIFWRRKKSDDLVRKIREALIVSKIASARLRIIAEKVRDRNPSIYNKVLTLQMELDRLALRLETLLHTRLHVIPELSKVKVMIGEVKQHLEPVAPQLASLLSEVEEAIDMLSSTSSPSGVVVAGMVDEDVRSILEEAQEAARLAKAKYEA